MPTTPNTVLNTVSVREKGRNAGGAVVSAYYPDGSDQLDGKGTALLLVHGYNNSRDAANDSFATFIRDLETATGRSPLPWPVFGVQWPGDESNPVAGVLAYPSKIKVAAQAADMLVELLRGAFGPGGAPIILNVVGHSLGCRLTTDLLEAISDRWNEFNVVFDRVALMAAAVPTDRCQSDGNLRGGLDFANGVAALYSRGDWVLQYTFPLGQTAGGDGFFPVAVGRNGDPSNAFRLQLAMSGAKGAYTHSDYWPGAESAAAVAGFLRVPVPASIPDSTISNRELPPANTIASRNLPS